jgi:hypothetical protein
MHAQKQREKGGVIGILIENCDCVWLEGNVIANQSQAPPHDPPKEGIGTVHICQITAFHSQITIECQRRNVIRGEQETVSNMGRCKRSYSINVPNKTWQKWMLYDCRVAADEECQCSDSGTYVG